MGKIRPQATHSEHKNFINKPRTVFLNKSVAFFIIKSAAQEIEMLLKPTVQPKMLNWET
jgi:menaquinone-dependent protoporphyrinogen IX oxidase